MEARDYVQSLERGLTVLLSFGPDAPTQTLTQVAERTGLTRAAARRFMHTLVHIGYLGSDGKNYWLLPRILDLGHRYLAGQAWWQHALPIMEGLAATLKELCSICVLENQEVVYVAHFATSRFLSINLSVGSRLPAYPTALGRVLMAQLPDAELERRLESIETERFTPHTTTDKKKLHEILRRVRKVGHAIVDQELEIGLVGVAVPIGGSAGETTAAMGISLPAARAGKQEMARRFLPALIEARQRVAEALVKGQR